MNSRETHSLKIGDPAQPTKETKRPQTHSLKVKRQPSTANKEDQGNQETHSLKPETKVK